MPWNKANCKWFNVGEYMKAQHLASVKAVEKSKSFKANKGN